MDQPASPEKVEKKVDEIVEKDELKESRESREALTQESLKESEVKRVSDSQAERPKDFAATHKTVFEELAAARTGMKAVNEVIRQGGGPYAEGEGRKAYDATLKEAQSHYFKAQRMADAYLWKTDAKGVPVTDKDGYPIPSKENIALQQREMQLEQEIQKMKEVKADQTQEGRARFEQALEEKNKIENMRRASGYARANHALALKFDSANLQGRDKVNRNFAANILLQDAATFDPKMKNDANFKKHLYAAESVVHGVPVPPSEQSDNSKPAPSDNTLPRPGPEGKPPVQGDVKPPVQGDVKPPVQGDVKPPVQGDGKPPVQGDGKPPEQNETPKPTDRVSLPHGAVLEPQGNQVYINFRDMRVPTWTSNRPDGSPTPPFKDGSSERADGLLRPVKDESGNVLGMDNKPLHDAKGVRRIDSTGAPVMGMLDATDPRLMSKKASDATTAPVTKENRDAFNQAIASADSIDRVSLSMAIVKNEQIISDAKFGDARAWETKYREQLQDRSRVLNEMKQMNVGLSEKQATALGAMWGKPVDAFLADPKNAQVKADLESDKAKWDVILPKLKEFETVNAQIKAAEKELVDKQDLAERVKIVREADAQKREMTSLFASSIDTRAGYLAKLLDDPAVKKYQDLPSDQKDKDALKDDPNVQEAKRLVVELAKSHEDLKKRLVGTSTSLGVDLAKEAPKVVVSGDAATKPADAPAGEGDKPATDGKPADATKPKDLTQEQLESVQRASEHYDAFMSKSQNGTKALSKEDWDKLGPTWEKAINDNASIPAATLEAYKEVARNNYGAQIREMLALEKAKKTDPATLTDEDRKAIKSEDVEAQATKALETWIQVSTLHGKALASLTADKKQAYIDLEKKFNTDLAAAKAEAGADEAKFQAASEKLQAARVEEQKKLSPDLAKAMDILGSAMTDPKIYFASRFHQQFKNINAYTHVNEFKAQYAQALVLQGGKENFDKAKALVTEAVKDETAAAMLENSELGLKLLSDVGVNTPAIQKYQDQANKIFPEMGLAQKAEAVLADKSKDRKAAFEEANKLFAEATAVIDAEVKEKGGIDSLREKRDLLAMQLGMALENFQKEARNLPGPDSPEKTAAEKRIRESIKGMSSAELLQGLMGMKGPQMQSDMTAILTDTDKTTRQDMAILSKKIENYSNLRMQHALAANAYGHDTDDKAAKAKSIALVEEIRTLDPFAFRKGPDAANFQGALKQAQDGRRMDLSDKKAQAIAFSEAAKVTIDAAKGPIDNFLGLDGASHLVNGLSLKATGHYLNEIPYHIGDVVGFPFGGSREADERIVSQLAMAQLSNEQEAQAQREAMTREGKSALKGILGDGAGIATTFATGYGLNYGMNAIGALSNVDPRIKLGVSVLGGLAVGGATNNLIRGEETLSFTGYARNTGGSALTAAAIYGLRSLPTQQALQPGTVGAIGEKFAIEGGLKGTTAAAIAPELTAAGGNFWARATAQAPHRLWPLSYTPVRVGLTAAADGTAAAGSTWLKPWTKVAVNYVGWGGEKTAQMLANGTINLAEWQARRAGSQFIGTAATGYLVGSGYQGLKLATGERTEGKDYSDWRQWSSEMNASGKNVALSAAFFLPMAGTFARGFGYGRIENAVGSGTQALFSKIGAPEAAAGLSSAALVWTQPALAGASKWGSAAVYDTKYREAEKLVAKKKEEIRANIAAEEAKLKGTQQPQPAPEKK